MRVVQSLIVHTLAPKSILKYQSHLIDVSRNNSDRPQPILNNPISSNNRFNRIGRQSAQSARQRHNQYEICFRANCFRVLFDFSLLRDFLANGFNFRQPTYKKFATQTPCISKYIVWHQRISENRFK